MFLEVPDLLTPPEIARLREIAAKSAFIDGRITNPHSKVKNNAQLGYSDQAYAESSRMMAGALQRNEAFRAFAFPRSMAPPMLTKYASGKNYGLHADAPFMPIGERPLRSDLSCTIFVSAPETYEGGALSVLLGTRRLEFKGAAGSAIIYPSDRLHEVIPVTAGERIVGLTFIESRIADAKNRELLYELNDVVGEEGLNMSRENFTRLERVQSSLHRLWADPG
jgi:PKHD-type hydroxylase